MKSRSISNARRIALYSGSNTSAQRKRDQDFIAPNVNSEKWKRLEERKNGPSLVKLQLHWQSPANLLRSAQATAARCVGYHRRLWPSSMRSLLDGLTEDSVAHCLGIYYAMTDFDRPQNSCEFDNFV